MGCPTILGTNCGKENFYIVGFGEKNNVSAFHVIAGLEQDIPDNQNETQRPPSEWLLHKNSMLLFDEFSFCRSSDVLCLRFAYRMEETLINMFLSGYSNAEVNADISLGDSQINGWYIPFLHLVFLFWNFLNFVL
mgnify:CR=1 FL=1|jgi:hypothetical protein